MPICSYLVIPQEGAVVRVHARLAEMPECEVVQADNHDLLLLVTETSTPVHEETLRARLETTDGIQALLLTFGELDPGGPDSRSHL